MSSLLPTASAAHCLPTAPGKVNSTAKPRLLVLSHVDPTSRLSGQQQRVYYSLLALRTHFHLTFVGLAPAGQAAQRSLQLRELCDEVEILPSVYAASPASRLWHRLLGLIYQRQCGLKFSNYCIGKVEFRPRRLAAILGARRFDLALFEYFHAADCAPLLQQHGVRCVLDTHNILWQAFARQLSARGLTGNAKDHALSRYRAAEEAAWAKFDALIAISRAERDYIRSRLRAGQQLFYAPMGVPLADWPYSWSPAQPLRVAYYGGLGSAHNAQDARRCYQLIMPRVWRAFPQAELWLVGNNPPPDLRSLPDRDPRVKVTGFLERVQEVLKTMTLLLCPFTGSYGFRSRVIEAMALGLPVVATPDAVHGMDLQVNHGLFLGDTDAALATAALRLLTREAFARVHSRAARAQVENHFSFETSYGRLARELSGFVGQERTLLNQ